MGVGFCVQQINNVDKIDKYKVVVFGTHFTFSCNNVTNMVELKYFFLLFFLLNYWVWVVNICPLLDVWRGVGGVTPLFKSGSLGMKTDCLQLGCGHQT